MKQERSQINNLILHLKDLEKEQTEPKLAEEKNIRAETNKIENRNLTEKVNQTKSWFFEKVNKIDKPLARLSRKKQKGPRSTKL